MRRRAVIGVLGVAVALAAGTADALPRARSVSYDFVGPGVVRGDLGPGTGDPRAVARAVLDAHAGRLGVASTEFRLDGVRRSVIGTHVRGHQVRGGVRVDGTFAAVHVVDGRVVWVQARDDDRPGGPSVRPVPASAAVGAALRRLGLTASHRVAIRRVLVPAGRRLADTWRVSVLSLSPARALSVDVDARTGVVRRVASDVRPADATALLFDPNPVVTLRDTSLRQPEESGSLVDRDLDSEALTRARVSMPLRDVDTAGLAAGRMTGPHVSVQMSVPVPATSTFDFTRSDPRFEGLMAYAHLDRLQRHLQALGFTGERGVNLEPQDVYALRLEGFDNSAYLPPFDAIVLGAGGVDDGEDAEVVVHEYGHALQDAQVPGFSGSGEAGVMGEGFGDLLAAAYFARASSRGFGDTCMFDWDSTSVGGRDPRCLRRLDSAMTYDDMTGAKHVDGQVWSTFLWRVRERLGSSTAERSDNVIRLVVASHEVLAPTATISDGVAALITAARALGQPGWERVVRAEAARSRLPLRA